MAIWPLFNIFWVAWPNGHIFLMLRFPWCATPTSTFNHINSILDKNTINIVRIYTPQTSPAQNRLNPSQSGIKSGTLNRTPIKKGDPQLFGNYRPVSTLPIFGKIFEKIIFNRLHSFLCAKNIIYENQFGFRKNHSTSHAINYSVNKILEDLNKNQHVLGIFIDLSKAFDTINHNKLLRKLSNYGIRGTGPVRHIQVSR